MIHDILVLFIIIFGVYMVHKDLKTRRENENRFRYTRQLEDQLNSQLEDRDRRFNSLLDQFHDYERRIAKAKAILGKPEPESCIEKALEALEGNEHPLDSHG